VDLDAVAAVGLGAIERLVGQFEQLLGTLRLLVQPRDARADVAVSIVCSGSSTRNSSPP
jgi:hypothetical protein